MGKLPRNERGHFVKPECPECGDPLQIDGGSWEGERWSCTGLIDPEDDSKPLAPCMFVHRDGQPFPEATP